MLYINLCVRDVILYVLVKHADIVIMFLGNFAIFYCNFDKSHFIVTRVTRSHVYLVLS